MYTLYSENTSAFSLLQPIGVNKCIALRDKSYRFYIREDTLFFDIVYIKSNTLRETVEVEKNAKTDYSIHIQDDNIHIAVANKNYDLIYRLYDSQNFTREIIYRFDGDIGIPSDPVIKAQGCEVHIVVSFIRIKKPRAWSINSYSKKDGIWLKRIIDEGHGLCYTQHCLCNDNGPNIHLLYKYFDKRSQHIKYAFCDRNNLRWCRPKVVCNNGIDKYWPHIFINILGQIFFLWLEICDEIELCIANKNAAEDYDKLKITSTIQGITIWNDRYHIYAISCEESRYFYDLCCIEQELPINIEKKHVARREFNMDTAKVKLFLDIKRELEQRIVEMEENLKTANINSTTEMQRLIERNTGYQKKLEDKGNRIEELKSMVNSLLCEKNLLEKKQEGPEERLDESPKESSDESSDESPEECSNESADESPDESAVESADESPDENSDECPDESADVKGSVINNISDNKYKRNKLLIFIKPLTKKLLRIIKKYKNKAIS